MIQTRVWLDARGRGRAGGRGGVPARRRCLRTRKEFRFPFHAFLSPSVLSTSPATSLSSFPSSFLLPHGPARLQIRTHFIRDRVPDSHLHQLLPHGGSTPSLARFPSLPVSLIPCASGGLLKRGKGGGGACCKPCQGMEEGIIEVESVP